MKVTLLGHASVLVEMDGATCLMDPVFFDPFEEGTVVSCPRRTVYPARLPAIDTLIVSHRHPDHFDIASLARLPRDCDAICPADPLIVYALERLGFSRIHPVHPMAEITSDRFELYPTRSEVPRVHEFGMVFRDASGSFWNQVDTSLSDETIARVGERFGRVDLLFAMYASQNFEFFDSHTARFPASTHRRNMETALAIAPRMLAPGSAGFSFCGERAWLNAFLFPISRQRFITDLAALDPTLDARVMNPGDVFEIDGGSVAHQAGASDIAVMERDDTDALQFDPTAPIPDLADPNPEGHAPARLAAACEGFIGGAMADFVATAYRDGDAVVDLYRRHQACYAVGIVLPDAQTRWHSFAFDEQGASHASGSTVPRADVTHRIAASALLGWTEHRKSFFYVRALSRRHGALHHLEWHGEAVALTPVNLPDLLMYYVLNKSAGADQAAKRHIDLQIAAAQGDAAPPD